MSKASSTRRPRPRKASVLPQPAREPRGAEVTAEKLLQATHELFFESGGAEPSVSQICERADVRVAMVSYCFGGKAQLLDALVERTLGGIMAEQDALIARNLPPEEALAVQVEAFVRNLVRYPYINSLTSRLATGDRTVAGMGETFFRPTIAFYEKLIDEGVATGTFRPVDPTLLLFSVAGACDFLFTARSWLAETGQALDDATVDRFAEHTVQLVLHGVLAR